MKLCKDCKHAVMPSPLQAIYGHGYSIAMCGHPDAKRSVVDGSIETTCVQARGGSVFGQVTNVSVCWPDAKLFEQAPPAEPKPEMQPYSIVPVETERDKTLWEKAKHWFI